MANESKKKKDSNASRSRRKDSDGRSRQAKEKGEAADGEEEDASQARPVTGRQVTSPVPPEAKKGQAAPDKSAGAAGGGEDAASPADRPAEEKEEEEEGGGEEPRGGQGVASGAPGAGHPAAAVGESHPMPTGQPELAAAEAQSASAQMPSLEAPERSQVDWGLRCVLLGVVVALVVLIAIAATLARVASHQTSVPEYRWSHNLKLLALAVPLTFAVVIAFMLRQQYEVRLERARLKRQEILWKYVLLAAGFLCAAGVLASKYYFKRILPEMEKRRRETVTLRLVMYFILAVGASAAAKIANNILGHPYRRGRRRRRR